MQATKSGFYGLFFLVLLSSQLMRPHVGSSIVQILIDTALQLVVVFILIAVLAKGDYKNPTGFRVVLWCIVFMLGLVSTVLETLEFYNTVSNDRIDMLFFAIILFSVAIYAGILDCSSVKTAGMFVSFLLVFSIVAVILFNLPNAKLNNIEIMADITTESTLRNSLSLVVLVPTFSVFNRQHELKTSRVAVLMLSVLVVVVACAVTVEAILKSNSPFFTIPIHTLAVMAEFSIFRRLDVVVRIILFLSGIMKMCVFGSSLSFILKRRIFYFVMAASFLLSLVIYNIAIDGIVLVIGLVALAAVLVSLIPYKKAAKALAVFLLIPLFVGCSGQELRERAAVTMTFVDWDGQYEISMLVVTEYGKDEPITSLVSGEGESISAALYEAATSVNGELYMGINDLIILGAGLSSLDFSSMLTQLYDVRLSTGKSYFFLSEHTSQELADNERTLMDSAEAVLKQSSDNRTVSKRIYDITMNNGHVDGVYPIIDIFAENGTVANSAALYNSGNRVATLDREELETVAALSGDRDRVAVEYKFSGADFVSELSDFDAGFEFEQGALTVRVSATAEGRLQQVQKEMIEQAIAERVADIIQLSIEKENDLFSLEKTFDISLAEIETIGVVSNTEDRKVWI